MRVHSFSARKAAYWFLAVACGALLAASVYAFYQKWGPSRKTLENISFGMPPGSQISYGNHPNFNDGLEKISYATRDELRRAADLSANGSGRQALEVFEAIEATHPNLIAAKWGEMNALFDMDSLQENQRIYRDQLSLFFEKKYAETGVPFFIESHEKERNGNRQSAEELARQASEISPAVMEFRLWYGRLLSEEKRYAQAIAETHMAISLSDGVFSKPYEQLALLYHAKGNLDSCSAVVSYALSKFPADVQLLVLQGYLKEYAGKFDDAEKNYRRVLAIRPSFIKAQNALATLGEKSPPGNSPGVHLTPQDRSQVACDILEPLVNTYPDNLPLREALGRAYIKGRSFELARIQFKEIQSKDPDYPDIQLRIQEASAVRPGKIRDDALTQDVKRVMDSLRTAQVPSVGHDFSTLLGHYLVRYGVYPKEFFSKYALSAFRHIGKNVWQETFFQAPYMHQYTVGFDSLNQFSWVHVLVKDSSRIESVVGRTPEIYDRLVKQNTRISGIGSGTGETDCNGTVLEGVVWETQDNFDFLARFMDKPKEVRMIRFNRKELPSVMKLCDYVPYLKKY